MQATDRLSIGEVAERSGFAASALRYYEELGLIASQRTTSGRRTYERAVLRRLSFIRAAANVGLSLDEVAAELNRLPDNRTPTKADWHRISRHWRSRLDEQIVALQALRDGLDSCIGCGCLSLKQCLLSNPNDVLAESNEAPGAARLPSLLRREHRLR